MKKYNKSQKKVTLIEMLTTRKIYYFLGFLISFFIMWICYTQGKCSIKDVFGMGISMSFIFGHLVYYFDNHNIKKMTSADVRFGALLSREGLMNFGLKIFSIVAINVLLGMLSSI